jgi:hypothetical protein
MIGSVNHGVGSKHRPVSDGKSTKAVDRTAIVEAYLFTELYKIAIEPNDQVEIVASFPNSLGIMGTKRNNPLALRINHHGRNLLVNLVSPPVATSNASFSLALDHLVIYQPVPLAAGVAHGLFSSKVEFLPTLAEPQCLKNNG